MKRWRLPMAGRADDAPEAGPVDDPTGEAPRAEPAHDSAEARVLGALRSVIDPEVGLDIVTMGMVYRVTVDAGVARVVHTLTVRGCPMEAHITAGIQAAAGAVEGVEAVETRLVWDPPWHPGMIREGAL